MGSPTHLALTQQQGSHVGGGAVTLGFLTAGCWCRDEEVVAMTIKSGELGQWFSDGQ